jgi:hypothetical protein
MKRVSVDPGKYGLKAITKDDSGEWHYMYLRSKIMHDPMSVVGGDNYLVGYQGESYLIGEGADDYSLDIDKQSLQHKLCTYLAINHLAQDEQCRVVVGCPFNLFINTPKREEYLEYIKSGQIIKLEINKEDALINIDDVLVFPEAAGIVYSEPDEDFVDNVRGVLDIGGLNVNGCVFDNLNPVKESIFTVNMGSIILKNKLKNELNKIFYTNLQEHEIPGVMKKGLYIRGKREDKADRIINRVLGDHFSDILREAKKHNWSLDTLNITVGGGGSLDIGDGIFDFIPQAKMCQNPVWGNAKGYYNIAEMLL